MARHITFKQYSHHGIQKMMLHFLAQMANISIEYIGPALAYALYSQYRGTPRRMEHNQGLADQPDLEVTLRGLGAILRHPCIHRSAFPEARMKRLRGVSFTKSV